MIRRSAGRTRRSRYRGGYLPERRREVEKAFAKQRPGRLGASQRLESAIESARSCGRMAGPGHDPGTWNGRAARPSQRPAAAVIVRAAPHSIS